MILACEVESNRVWTVMFSMPLLRWPNFRVILWGQMLFNGLDVTPLQNGFGRNKLQQNLSWPKLNDLKCMD